MKIKKAEIGQYLQLLSAVINVEQGKWAYAVTRNIKRLESAYRLVGNAYWETHNKELKLINDGREKEDKEPINPIIYRKEKNNLIEKYSWYEDVVTIKEDGEDVEKKEKKQHLDNNRPSVYPKNIKKYEKESEKLDEFRIEEKTFLEVFEKEFDKTLDETVEIEFYKVGEEGVPENISANDLIQFDFMLKD
jgi:hypothetical protein